mmetsp:Transcript_2322/g.5431  ORF Transcript_2322/g.5431 Transcript_2322/m.5431 type:complete len:352 (-) Transcript_2322:2058-3113(-)
MLLRGLERCVLVCNLLHRLFKLGRELPSVSSCWPVLRRRVVGADRLLEFLARGLSSVNDTLNVETSVSQQVRYFQQKRLCGLAVVPSHHAPLQHLAHDVVTSFLVVCHLLEVGLQLLHLLHAQHLLSLHRSARLVLLQAEHMEVSAAGLEEVQEDIVDPLPRDLLLEVEVGVHGVPDAIGIETSILPLWVVNFGELKLDVDLGRELLVDATSVRHGHKDIEASAQQILWILHVVIDPVFLLVIHNSPVRLARLDLHVHDARLLRIVVDGIVVFRGHAEAQGLEVDGAVADVHGLDRVPERILLAVEQVRVQSSLHELGVELAHEVHAVDELVLLPDELRRRRFVHHLHHDH